MGDKSEIQWTDATWNPVTGCSKVSPGCAHCYAEAVTERYAGRPGWIGEHRPWTPANAEHNVRIRPERLEQPLRWRKPRMIFVNSMSDLFHEAVPARFIEDVFAVMALAPQHTFQVLTKRPERMRSLLRNPGFHINVLSRRWDILGVGHDPAAVARRLEQVPSDPIAQTCPWPLPNVWLGTSIENRRFVYRADLLRETPAAVRFISAEPLLGPLTFSPSGFWARGSDGQYHDHWPDGWIGDRLSLYEIDWLIVGGESGVGHRPMRMEWVRDLRDAAIGNGTRFFFKQWGGRTPKSGGRLLNGRTWDEMPAVEVSAGL